MDSQWTNEQELGYRWFSNPAVAGVSEQENVLDWIKSIGAGAAQGAGTGAVAGPWGALIGGLVGGGLGALQQATQAQSTAQRPSPPPVPSPASQPVPPAASTSGGKDGTGPAQQVAQLLPQLIQLIQTIQPVIASTQQSKGRARESEGEQESAETPVSDLDAENVLMDEQSVEDLDRIGRDYTAGI
jgi:hypothetical protein